LHKSDEFFVSSLSTQFETIAKYAFRLAHSEKGINVFDA